MNIYTTSDKHSNTHAHTHTFMIAFYITRFFVDIKRYLVYSKFYRYVKHFVRVVSYKRVSQVTPGQLRRLVNSYLGTRKRPPFTHTHLRSAYLAFKLLK